MKKTRRRLWGQHFLTDTRIRGRILRAFSPQPTDRVIEIGPGRGALTRLLAERVAALAAVEIDPLLADRLRDELAGRASLRIVEADILGMDDRRLRRLVDLPAGQKVRIIGNLPYGISTVLVRRIHDSPTVSDALVMVQKEVAARLVAPPGGRDYGILSVHMALRADARCLFDVPPGAFRPPPRVRSAIVRIHLPDRPTLPPDLLGPLDRVLSAAFGQRRKLLRNGLRGLLPAGPGRERLLQELLDAAGLPEKIRAEQVPPEQLLRLTRIMTREKTALL